MTLKCVARSACRFLAGLVSLAALVVGSGAAAAAESWPANVRALYEINFNGFNVGTFEFQAQAESQSYTLTGNAQFSLLLGAFSWAGETRSFGTIVNQAPKPASFTFDFKSNMRAGSTKLGFSDDSVTNIMNLPPMMTSGPVIPVREHHLKGVVDPLSAIMLLSRGAAADPCER